MLNRLRPVDADAPTYRWWVLGVTSIGALMANATALVTDAFPRPELGKALAAAEARPALESRGAR